MDNGSRLAGPGFRFAGRPIPFLRAVLFLGILAVVSHARPCPAFFQADGIHLNAYFDFRAKYDGFRGKNRFFMRAHHLGLAANASAGPVQFYAELEYEDSAEIVIENSQINPEKTSDSGKAKVTSAWVRYVIREELDLTFGKFLSPLSFYQQRHFPILQTSIHKPKGVARILPTDSLVGVLASGRARTAGWGLRYFAGVVQDWSGLVNDKDVNANLPVLFRIEASPPFAEGLDAGLGVMYGTDGRDLFDDETDMTFESADKLLVALDASYEQGRLSLECLGHHVQVEPEGAAYRQIGAYALFRYDLTPRFSPWTMLEYADFRTGDGLVDSRAFSLGLNVTLTEEFKIKTEVVGEQKKGREAVSAEISLVSFF